MSGGMVASGLLLIVVGLWLLLQTLAGGLPSRLVKLATGGGSSSNGGGDFGAGGGDFGGGDVA